MHAGADQEQATPSPSRLIGAGCIPPASSQRGVERDGVLQPLSKGLRVPHLRLQEQYIRCQDLEIGGDARLVVRLQEPDSLA